MRPCIRNLKCFKKGCPEKKWTEANQDGCPAWETMIISTTENPLKKESISDCLDILLFKLKFNELALMESGVMATESFRNGMTEKVGDEIVPKIDRGIKQILSLTTKIPKQIGGSNG